MRFRSPTPTPIRIALTSGHTTIIGPDWRDDVPLIFHHAAMTHGCERDDNSVVPVEVSVKPSENASNQVGDYDTLYRRALTTMLEREEDGDFTADSLPNINAVAKLCGIRARKEDVLRVFRAMKDEADAASND